MLGSDLCSAATAGGDELVALPRAELDITDPGASSRRLSQRCAPTP